MARLHPETTMRMTAAPTEAENRMRRRLDLLPQVVFEMDGTGSLVFLNHAWTQALGYAAADGIGQLLGKFVVEEDQRLYSRIMSGEIPGTAGHAPIRILRSDGSAVWMEISIAPLDDGGMVGSLRDVSSRKLADEELARCSLAASEAKSGFLANISHEMRTPLNIILGSTALAQDPGIDPVLLVKHLQRIEANAGILLRMISGILDVAFIESGRFDFERAPVALRACLSAAIAPLAEQAAARGVDCSLMFDELLPGQIIGDSDRLRQIVTNLVENAIKFTACGSVRVEAIRVTPSPGGGDWLEIRVIDSGCGISPEAQQRIFGRFERGDESTSRHSPGVGLGLSIVKALVEGLGGSVSVRSRPGEGADFRVLLPLEPVKEGEPRDRPQNPEAGVTRSNRSAREGGLPFRILIAEDSDPNYAIAEIFLRRAGYTVTRAINGHFAVAAAAGVDLILMDIEMPEMDGLEATRRIREAERLASRRAVPILALSAHGGAAFRESCLAAGCSGFLAKPVRYELVCLAVKEALQKQPGVGTSHE